MNKKGQVTIFIIMAILIVVAGVLYFSFRDTIDEKVGIGVNGEPVKVYVDECLQDVSKEVVYLVGNGGGYVFGPELSNESGFNYQILENESYFPGLEEIEEEISLYTTVILISCLDGFESFSNFEIEAGEAEVFVDILNDSVEVNLDYPISIRKGEEIIRYEDFGQAVVPVRLGEMHFVMGKLISENYYSEEGICVSCMVDLAYEHDFVFENVNFRGEDLFILTDFENERTEEPYRFVFVNGGINE